jgi:glycosyltransferase involved in cell wall biosynthesis
LAQNDKIVIKVFYTWGEGVLLNKRDPGFGQVIEWDIPLLEGYEHSFVENRSADPGSHHFKGIINPALNAAIENWEADAVLVFGWAFQSHLKCLRYFHGKIPVLFRGDSTLLDESKGFKQGIRRLALTWVYRNVDYAFYTGENNRQYFLAHGLRGGRLIYAPHAVDNHRFAEPTAVYEKEALMIRKKLGIHEDDLVLLFVGKFEKKKNPLFLIALLNTIADRRLKVLFVGSGALLPQIESAARRDARVIIMDFQNQQQMPAIYRAADLFVLPSTGPGETWGLAINEAMAAGKAVVASGKAGGTIDLIEDGVNGLVLDLQNTVPLQILVKAALNDKMLLKEMGHQSKAKIKAFTFHHIARAIEDCVLSK